MKKFLLFVLFLCPIVSMAQEQTKIDSTMTFRISEIEVYPEYLKEYLEFAHNVGATSVKEEPGVICIYPMQQLRNNWHIHHGAHQILICVSGEGIYQEWGKPAIRLHAGDIIDIPEGAKHWHGATRDSWFQHLASHVHVGNPESNEWLEPVTDEQYNEANK